MEGARPQPHARARASPAPARGKSAPPQVNRARRGAASERAARPGGPPRVLRSPRGDRRARTGPARPLAGAGTPGAAPALLPGHPRDAEGQTRKLPRPSPLRLAERRREAATPPRRPGSRSPDAPRAVSGSCRLPEPPRHTGPHGRAGGTSGTGLPPAPRRPPRPPAPRGAARAAPAAAPPHPPSPAHPAVRRGSPATGGGLHAGGRAAPAGRASWSALPPRRGGEGRGPGTPSRRLPLLFHPLPPPASP